MDDRNQKLNKTAISVNLDTTPVLYTDNVHIETNEFGVVCDVTQRVGNQIRIVARFGMSREHAKHFVEELGKLLAVTEKRSKLTKQN
ncbi:hypothetical protein C4579_02790 [Candidatus Microgenomates bacterium]|nr:MAG: hypothetical protein C4579_02790 [Candidatus Microgenomates bacterium]